MVGELRLIQSVGVQPLQHIRHRGLHQVLMKQRAQLELGRGAKLLQAGRVGHTVNDHAADEIVEGGDHSQLDARCGRLRFDGNIVIAAGTIQRVDRRAHVGQSQWRADAQTQALIELALLQRLLRRVADDGHNSPPFPRLRARVLR